nr:AlkA N-terminal domain-containing protein [Paludisphaera rhizosphaerae]
MAASRIGETIGDAARTVEMLAEELGVGARHLRRILDRTLGVSPVELAQTQRLLLAKQLLTETRLPITSIVFASGFASIRRFNALFRERYRLTPSELRKSSGPPVSGESICLSLSYRPPFEWDEMLGFLAPRAVAGVEAVLGQAYLRTIDMGGRKGWLKVTPGSNSHALVVETPMTLASVLPQILARLRGLFDLDARPDVIADHLGRDPILGESVRRHSGLRVPGAFDGFELGVRAVLGQQVSVRAATTLAGRYAERFGEAIETPFPELTRLTPTPERIAKAELDDVTGIGLVGSRAACLLSLAKAVCDGDVSLSPGPDPSASIEQLKSIPGVGSWTANYIAMRCFRWPDAFPHGDLGLRKALGGCSPDELLETAEAWRPWRAYAAMHLWRASVMKQCVSIKETSE